MDQDDVEEFLAVGKALRINGLNAKEQDQEQEQDTVTNTQSIQHIKEEVFQGENEGVECFKYTSETILGSSSGNNNERKRSKKTALRKHKPIDYLELAGIQQLVNLLSNFVFQVREQRTRRIGCLVTSVASWPIVMML